MTSLTTSGRVQAVVAAELLDDRYRLVTLLHRADDIETWQAHDARLNRDVIVELMPPAAQLQELLTTKYSERVPVYDAGSHTWGGDPRTFVVTTERPDARSTSYRPRHSSRDAATGAVTTVTINPGRAELADEQQPLSVGNWQRTDRVRRPARSWRGRKVDAPPRQTWSRLRPTDR